MSRSPFTRSFPLSSLLRSLSSLTETAAVVYITTVFSWESSSSRQRATQIKPGLRLALLGLLWFPMCPCATLPMGTAEKCYTCLFTGAFERIMCNGLDLDSVSFRQSSGLVGPQQCSTHKRTLLIRFKILFHSPIEIQDGCFEPLNPIMNSGKKLNVSAHALMQFYRSDCGFHDAMINYGDKQSSIRQGGWMSLLLKYGDVLPQFDHFSRHVLKRRNRFLMIIRNAGTHFKLITLHFGQILFTNISIVFRLEQ